MKTYEEMAQSVIHRAKAHKMVRNRWIIGSVAAVVAVGVCLSVMVKNRPEDDPTLQTQPATTVPNEMVVIPVPTGDTPLQTLPSNEVKNHRVTFLHNDGSQSSHMDLDVQTSSQMEIRVKDIRGLSEEEVESLGKAEAMYAQSLVDAHPEAKGYNWVQGAKDNTLITCITTGHFIIATEHPEWIESIYAATQGTVKLDNMEFASDDYMKNPTPFLPDEYALNHDQIQQRYYAPYGGLEIVCEITNRAEIALDEGEVTLGDLHDTITFTVTYVDGTVEEHAIDMIFNESGEVYALYRGATAAA